MFFSYCEYYVTIFHTSDLTIPPLKQQACFHGKEQQIPMAQQLYRFGKLVNRWMLLGTPGNLWELFFFAYKKDARKQLILLDHKG